MIEKKAVFITGCNGGIGKALCQAFGSAGYLVIGSDRHAEKIASCDLYLSCDLLAFVSDDASRQSLQRAVRAFVGDRSAKLAALINNAALQVTGTLAQVLLSDFLACHQVNVAAPFAFAQLFEDDLRRAKGTVINVGSIHARLTKPGFCAYSTSKAALSGLGRALALEFAGDVTVNTISPAATKTDMLVDGFREQPAKYQELAAFHPAGRIAEPGEIADLALFLCSDGARFITGADFPIDGGIGGRLHDPA